MLCIQQSSGFFCFRHREVLKNIAYSVKMGMQLSHGGSKSLRYGYDSSNKVRFPDENYAREVMQLETIGLEMLNMDGTVIKDGRGNPIPTYDTEDIIVFSRAWTGFDKAVRRGNNEELDHLTISWM
jgi:cullin-associated NEDD8-dissociated protein 1